MPNVNSQPLFQFSVCFSNRCWWGICYRVVVDLKLEGEVIWYAMPLNGIALYRWWRWKVHCGAKCGSYRLERWLIVGQKELPKQDKGQHLTNIDHRQFCRLALILLSFWWFALSFAPSSPGRGNLTGLHQFSNIWLQKSIPSLQLFMLRLDTLNLVHYLKKAVL